MRKRIVTLALCAALLLCAAPVQVQGAGSTGFSDVPANIWYEYALSQMLKITPGIINGYPDGYFHPDKSVTRGEFLKMIITAAEEGHTIDRSQTAIHWAYPYYATALENNVLVADAYASSASGSGANGAEPMFPGTYQALEEPVSRYEMAVIISNVCTNMLMEKTVIANNASVHIKDYASIAPQYTTAVEQTFGKGLLEGYTDGSFGGSHNLNRCEAAVVVYRLLWAGERQMPGWAEEQPIQVTPIASGSGFLGYKSFALWMHQDGHVSAYGSVDATARAYLFGAGTAAAARGYFISSAEAQPYMQIVTVPIWVVDKTGNKYPSTATMSVNKVLAEEVQLIFQQIFNDPERFPIYGGWAVGCTRFSDTMRHAWGAAIDINPYYNCECNFGAGYLRVTCGYGWQPPGVTEWAGRPISAYQGSMTWENSIYSISPYGSVVKAFQDYGWGWGGSWGGTSYDFMHFSILYGW